MSSRLSPAHLKARNNLLQSDQSPPHCHAKYSGYEARFDFNGNILEGELPRRATGFVQEWISQHHSELNLNWEKARSGEPLDYISPLE